MFILTLKSGEIINQYRIREEHRRGRESSQLYTSFFFSFNYHLFKNENILIRDASDS